MLSEWRACRSIPGACRHGSGRLYGPLIRQPILVYAASAEEIRRTLRRANDKRLGVSIYTGELFSTNNDIDNRAAVASVSTEGLDLVGVAIHADRKEVDKVTRGLTLHP